MIVAMCPVHKYQVCHNGEACNIWKLCYSWLLLMPYRSNFSENMVRKLTRKTDSRAYGEAALCAALVAIQQGQPVKTVARQYNIPPKTLMRHRDRHVRAPGAVQLGRNVPVLPHQFEEQLVRDIQIMESQMYALMTTDVRHLTYELTEWQNLQHHFDRNTHTIRYRPSICHSLQQICHCGFCNQGI